MAIIISLSIITLAVIVGISSGLILNKDDGFIEEAAEEIIELKSEQVLGLKDGTLHIDLTPNSKEVDDRK